MSGYLREIAAEAERRGYAFNASLIADLPSCDLLQETRGQLDFEWQHLRSKLSLRSPAWYAKCKQTVRPEAHPLFRIGPGPVRDWEKSSATVQKIDAHSI